MRAASLVYFYVLRLRARWMQELFALLGIAVGVGLLFAAQVANTSLTDSVGQLVKGTVGDAELQLIARGPQGLDLALLQDVRRSPGVKDAAAVVEVRTTVRGPKAAMPITLFGADRSLARLGGPLVQRLRGAQAAGGGEIVALPTEAARQLGVPLGGRLEFQIGDRIVRTRLAAQLMETDIGGLVHNPLAIAPLPYVQRLANLRGRATRDTTVMTASGPAG